MGSHCEKGLAGQLFLVKLMEMNGVVRIRLWAQRTQNSNVLWNCWLAMNDPKWVVQEGLGKQLFLAVHSESFLKDYHVEPRSMPLLVWLWMVLCP